MVIGVTVMEAGAVQVMGVALTTPVLQGKRRMQTSTLWVRLWTQWVSLRVKQAMRQ
jgi:hypothetical protein